MNRYEMFFFVVVVMLFFFFIFLYGESLVKYLFFQLRKLFDIIIIILYPTPSIFFHYSVFHFLSVIKISSFFRLRAKFG